MLKRRYVFPLVLVLSLALLATGIVVRLSDRGAAAERAGLPTLSHNPFPASLSLSRSGSMTSGTVVAASVAGVTKSAIKQVRLYDNGRLVMSSTPKAGRSSGTLRWPALRPGVHVLHGEVSNDKDETSTTAPSTVTVATPPWVAPPAGKPGPKPAPLPKGLAKPGPGAMKKLAFGQADPVHIALPPGLNAKGLESYLGVDPGAVVIDMPKGTQDVPLTLLPPGVFLPAGAAASVDLAGLLSVQPVTEATSGVGYGDPDFVLTGKVQTCKVLMSVTGAGKSNVTLERMEPGTPGFVQIAKRSGDGPLDVPGERPGTTLYRALHPSSNASGTIALTLPDTCGGGWKGNVSLIHGILKIPVPADRMYFYLGAGKQPFIRVPADPNAFFHAPTTQVDVSEYLPYMYSNPPLRLEVWKSEKGEAAKLGEATALLLDQQDPADLIGEPKALDVSITSPVDADKYLSLASDKLVRLRWEAASPRVSKVFYQVLSVPLSPANKAISPPGLLGYGVSFREDVDPYFGTFEIDTAAISQDPVSAPQSVQAAAGQEAPAPTGTVSGLSITPGEVTSLGDGKQVLAKPVNTDTAKAALEQGTATQLEDLLSDLGPAAHGRIYVRALGFENGDYLSMVSPVVAIDLPQAVAPPVLPLTLKSGSFGTVRAPNLGYADCAQIVVPWADAFPSPASVDPADMMKAFYPTSGTYCARQFQSSTECDVFCYVGQSFDEAAAAVSEIWDAIAATYTEIIDVAAAVIGEYNPICLTAKAADESAGETCAKYGKVVAKAAIVAVLAAYGIPPSLPTSSQLKSAAQGEVEAVALILVEELGVPCDSMRLDKEDSATAVSAAKKGGVDVPTGGDGTVGACEAAIHYLIEKVKAQAKASVEQGIAIATGLPWWEVAGASLTPDPRAQLLPMSATVTASGPDTGDLACEVGLEFNGPAPFKDAPVLLGRAEGNTYVGGAVTSEPRFPSLDVNSIYPGMVIRGTVKGGCASGEVKLKTTVLEPLP